MHTQSSLTPRCFLTVFEAIGGGVGCELAGGSTVPRGDFFGFVELNKEIHLVRCDAFDAERLRFGVR
jgi:hypothetical protein